MKKVGFLTTQLKLKLQILTCILTYSSIHRMCCSNNNTSKPAGTTLSFGMVEGSEKEMILHSYSYVVVKETKCGYLYLYIMLIKAEERSKSKV